MYPSAQEVAEQVVLQVADQLSGFESKANEIIETQNRNLTTQWILIGFTVAVNIGLVLVMLGWMRPRLREGR